MKRSGAAFIYTLLLPVLGCIAAALLAAGGGREGAEQAAQIGDAPAGSAIVMTKTVGTNPAECAATDTITISPGTLVLYCYRVTNTGHTPLNSHTLEDTELGRLLEQAPFTLYSGETTVISASATINVTTVNTATWTAADNSMPYSVDDEIPLDFEDISATGSEIVLDEDGVSNAMSLGFDFDYYGIPISSIFISANGFLTVLPGQDDGCCTGHSLPNPAEPNGVISGWWEDLSPPEGNGTIHIQALGTPPDRRFLVQFTNVQHFPSGNPVTMQYKLFEGSNILEIHYVAAPSDGGTHSAGIENQDGSLGLEYYRGTAGLNTPLAVRFAPVTETTAASDSATVIVERAEIAVAPAELTAQLQPDTQVTLPFTISNQGSAMLEWSIVTESGGNPASGATIRSWNDRDWLYFTRFNLDTPEILPNVAPFNPTGTFIGAGEYINGLSYMLDFGHNLLAVDDAGNLVSQQPATVPPYGEKYSGMALHPVDGTVFASSANGSTSSLFTFNVFTGSASRIGPITGAPNVIALAADGTGRLFAYDIDTDTFMEIDRVTAHPRNVTPLPFDAQYGQGMGYDPASGQLYMLAFNNDSFRGELWLVDTSQPAEPLFTFAGVLGTSVPGGVSQLTWGGTELDNAGDDCAPAGIPWLAAHPAEGDTPVGMASQVAVTVDAAGLGNGVYTATLCIESNDPANAVVRVPVQLTVAELPTATPTVLPPTSTPHPSSTPPIATPSTTPEAPSPTPAVPTPTTIGPTPTAVGPTPTTIGPTPTAVGPTPTTIGPTPTAVGPTPTTIGPTPTTIGPTPTTIGPTPTAVSPTPTTIGPTPTAVGPTPTTIGPTPTTVGPTPTAVGLTPTPAYRTLLPLALAADLNAVENVPTSVELSRFTGDREGTWLLFLVMVGMAIILWVSLSRNRNAWVQIWRDGHDQESDQAEHHSGGK